jgi:uncharacterized membrane protein
MNLGRALLVSLACMLVAAPAVAAKTPVEVSLSRAEVSTRIGESFDFDSEIRNAGTQPLPELVAHLNVAGLESGIYVDPEDWSEERTKFLPPLAPGESTNVGWNVKAVTGGRAAIYVVVLPGRSEPAVSPAMAVQIADTKDFNSDGVLPLAVGVPALLGAVALTVRRRRR